MDWFFVAMFIEMLMIGIFSNNMFHDEVLVLPGVSGFNEWSAGVFNGLVSGVCTFW